jgi:hypothetical protein
LAGENGLILAIHAIEHSDNYSRWNMPPEQKNIMLPKRKIDQIGTRAAETTHL